MNQTGRLLVIISILMGLAITYRIQVLLKPSYMFISISDKNSTPSYFNKVHYCSLDTYLPRLAEKTLETAQLTDILEPESLYKIVNVEVFDPLHKDSCVILSALDQESHFIHASYGKQVLPILEKFFKDSTCVLLLEIDKKALDNASIVLKEEQNKVGGEFFPHLYGTQKIPLSIIKTIIELHKKDATWTINTIGLIVPHIQV